MFSFDKVFDECPQHSNGEFDAFDSEFRMERMAAEQFPTNNGNFISSEELIDELYVGDRLQIRDSTYKVLQNIGSGCFGRVFKVKTHKDDKAVALKDTDRTLGMWEASITDKLQTRLPPEAAALYADVKVALFTQERSFLVMEMHIHGTLTDLFESPIFQQKMKNTRPLIMRYSSILLSAVRHLHSCQIIHGDLHPRNIMIMPPLDGSLMPQLKIIDFGHSVDMSHYPPEAKFSRTSHATSGWFKDNCWSFNSDIHDTVECIWYMLTSCYLTLKKDAFWMPMIYKEPADMDFWGPIIKTMLNFIDDKLPDLAALQQTVDERLDSIQDEADETFHNFNEYLKAQIPNHPFLH